MAVSVTTTINSGTYSPVSSEIWVQMNSASYSLPNFKYGVSVNRIDKATNAATLLGTATVPPRPNGGAGLYSPSRLLRTQLSYDLQPSEYSIKTAANSLIKYSLDITASWGCEEPIIYIPALYLGAVQILMADTADIAVFDVILLDKNNKNNCPQYDTLALVFIIDTTTYPGYFLVTLLFGSDVTITTPTFDNGYITNVGRTMGATPYYYAYNGTRQYDEIDTDFSNYVATNDTKWIQFLTNYGKNDYRQGISFTPGLYDSISKNVFPYEYETLSLMQDADLTNGVKAYITAWGVTYSSTQAISLSATQSDRRYDIPAGMGNYLKSNIFGNGIGLITNYAIYLVRNTGGAYKAIRFYKVVENCSPYEKNYRIAFLNRWGAFDYFNFNYKSSSTTSTTRTNYKKVLPYNYNVGDRANSILAQKANTSTTISTNFIREDEYNWLKEIITSPEVYLIENNWNFTSVTAVNGYNCYVSTTDKHNYKIGDSISVYQHKPNSYPGYDGAQTVTDIISEYSVRTDMASTGTSNVGGIASHTDLYKYPILITNNSYTVKSIIDEKIFTMSLTFEYSSDINLQNM